MNWSERVAPGVAVMRFRVEHKLAVITLESELESAADMIEQMAAELDRRTSRTFWAVYVCVLVAVVLGFSKL